MRERIASEPPASVAIVMLSALGDAVRVLPVVNALERAWPHVPITWFIEELPHRLVRGHEAVDSFVVVPRRRAPLRDWYREVRSIVRDYAFDVLLDLQVGLKAGLVTRAVRARTKLGFDRRRARDGNWLFTNDRIPPRPRRHVQEQYFEFLEYLGVDPHPVEWKLRLTDEERDAQRRFFTGRERTCAIAIGSSAQKKNWPPERYALLLGELQRTHEFQTILVGGPSADERAVADEILRTASVQLVDALGDDPRRLLYLIEGSDLAICPDSAPLHIAAAVGTPAIGLFGYTNPKRYAPFGRYHDLVVDGFAQWPGEPYAETAGSRPGGMDRITVEAVLEKVDIARARYLLETGGERTV